MTKTAYETQRDNFERQMAEEKNKKELLERHNQSLLVIAYWLMKENVCTIYLEDETIPAATEFVIPNDKVMEYFEHPFSHPDAVFDLDRLQPWDGT